VAGHSKSAHHAAAMMNIIERAFELAAESGSVSEVKVKLSREGYFNVQAHLTGRVIRRDIEQRLNPDLMVERKQRAG
jgi:hypothetical protein